MGMTRPATVLLIVVGILVAASPAAADRVYFSSSKGISYADLDGSGGGDLAITGVKASEVHGIALDPAAGRIYWASGSGSTSRISVAGLDGSGGAELTTTGAPLNWPRGVALDLGAGRIYWGNYQGPATERIGYAKLDGSGGSLLSTTGATAGNVLGVAIDPTTRRLYWTNEGGLAPVAYANLDGSGGDDVSVTGASISARNFAGVAIEPSEQRIYWTSHTLASPYEPVVSSAALNGSGGADLATPGAPEEFAEGVAIDPTARRVYWASTGILGNPGIYYAALDGSGAHPLNTAGAPAAGATFPALLKAPVGTGAPKLTAQLGLRPRFLTCDEGTWAADMPEALLYRAPRSFSYQWLRDGQPIPGATRSNIGVEAPPGGDYACQVTATNAGGSTTQTSKIQPVCCRPSPRARGARVAPVKGGRALVKLTCPAGTEPCAGRIHLEIARPPRRRARLSNLGEHPLVFCCKWLYGERSISIPPERTQIVKVKLSRVAKSKLRSSDRHRLRATLDGEPVVRRIILLKLAEKPKRR